LQAEAQHSYKIIYTFNRTYFDHTGSNGNLKVGAKVIVFDGGDRSESRTWKLSDITNVNSPDPFELSHR
jgi:hypothetical protein